MVWALWVLVGIVLFFMVCALVLLSFGAIRVWIEDLYLDTKDD
jgi:hypothetical protein